MKIEFVPNTSLDAPEGHLPFKVSLEASFSVLTERVASETLDALCSGLTPDKLIEKALCSLVVAGELQRQERGARRTSGLARPGFRN